MDHTRILLSYVSRLRGREIEAIMEAVNNSDYAIMQLGTASQVAAHRELTNVCNNAIGTISEHDIDTIDGIVSESVN